MQHTLVKATVPVVQTTAGPIRGRVLHAGLGSRRVWWFGGVPYAWADRFAVPVPPVPWTDELDAATPGAAAPQRADDPPVVPGLAPAAWSEDCLRAEVWTPSPSGSLPVIVWIPGGAFRTGAAGLPLYDGSRLCADGGVVVVGVNYRLGALGFLAADGVPSNLGLRDLLAAIDWVRDNAEAFGGDPDRIVLMGESAGAGAITQLLTRADLPVSGAIVLSGSATMTLDEATARRVAERVVTHAGVPDGDLDALRALPVDTLLDAQTATVAELAASVGAMPLHPWVDGDVVPRSPLDAAAADLLAPVPLVIGTTAHEMDLYRASMAPLPTEYALKVLTRTGAVFGLDETQAAAVLASCDGDLMTAIGDLTLQLPAQIIAASHRRRHLPVWRTVFAWEAPERRACHALDLPFHFATFDVDGWRAFAGADGERAGAAERLSDRMRSAWTTFAASGRPSCDPIGRWPAGDDDDVVWLHDDLSVRSDPAVRRILSWR